jgi:tetratricopeptide (TPR) repeat protein
MDTHEELTRVLASEHDRASAGDAPADSVDDETWAMLEDGLLDEQERAELLARLRRDPEARRRAADILRETAAEQPQTAGRRTLIFRIMPLAAAACILVAVGLFVVLRPSGPGDYGIDASQLARADVSLVQFGVPLDGSQTRDLADAPLSDADCDAILDRLAEPLSQSPPPAEALRLAALATLNAGRYSQGEDFARQWTAAQPEAPDAHNAYGMSLFQQQRYRDALVAFEQALALAPSRPDLLLNAALAADRCDQIDKAIDFLKEYLAKPEPRHTEMIQAWLERLESL